MVRKDSRPVSEDRMRAAHSAGINTSRDGRVSASMIEKGFKRLGREETTIKGE
jgi:hypothetical protein